MYLWYHDIDIIMVIKVQIYIAVPFGEPLLPTLKSFTSHAKTGNFDLRPVSDKQKSLSRTLLDYRELYSQIFANIYIS